MRILELQAHAKDTKELNFVLDSANGPLKGKWLDPWLGCFRLDGMPDNQMVTVHQWRKIYGDHEEFTVDNA